MTAEVFRCTPNNIACENHFYDFSLNVGPEECKTTLEKGFSAVETLVAPIFAKIVEKKELKISTVEKESLSEFLWLQFTRTKCIREHAKDFLPHFQQLDNNGTENPYVKMDPNNLSENDMKIIHSGFIMFSKHFAYEFYKLQWRLVSTEIDRPFLLTDHPVYMIPRLENTEYIGFGIIGTEFCFPITPKLMLKMMSDDTVKILTDKLKEKLKKSVEYHLKNEEVFDIMEELNKIETRNNTKCSVSEVERLNYAQIINSEKFIYSCENNFSIVEKFLKDHPEYKKPPKLILKNCMSKSCH